MEVGERHTVSFLKVEHLDSQQKERVRWLPV